MTYDGYERYLKYGHIYQDDLVKTELRKTLDTLLVKREAEIMDEFMTKKPMPNPTAGIIDQQKKLATYVENVEHYLSQRLNEVERRINTALESADTIPLDNRLQPHQEAKLPMWYNEKSFPFYALPLYKVICGVKSFFDSLRPSMSVEESRRVMQDANRDREMLTVMMVQKAISKCHKELAKAIRKNLDFATILIGDESATNKVVAQIVARHFCDVGYRKVQITQGNGVWLHIDVIYSGDAYSQG